MQPPGGGVGVSTTCGSGDGGRGRGIARWRIAAGASLSGT
jgi:hypothetical protein